MVSAWALNLTTGFSNFYGIGNEGGVYLIALLFSMFFMIFIVAKTRDIKLGIGTLMMSLFVFSFMDMFPLWMTMVTAIIMVAVILKIGEHSE